VKGVGMLERRVGESEPMYEALGETESPYVSVDGETNQDRRLSLTGNAAYQQIPKKTEKDLTYEN
jgi:hypothetical protein